LGFFHFVGASKRSEVGDPTPQKHQKKHNHKDRRRHKKQIAIHHFKALEGWDIVHNAARHAIPVLHLGTQILVSSDELLIDNE
jgi:hypothetical protein